MSLLTEAVAQEQQRIKRMISQYETELSCLPKGVLLTKSIKGSQYFYLQYRNGKKIVSKYIGRQSDKVEELQKQSDRRRHIQAINFDKVLIFPEPNEEWLDFVFVNRNGSYNGELYDIVFGPVANDTIYRTFIAYEEGILTKDETIARLKVKKLFDQMTFTTELALKELKYSGQFDAGRDQNE